MLILKSGLTVRYGTVRYGKVDEFEFHESHKHLRRAEGPYVLISKTAPRGGFESKLLIPVMLMA